MTYKCEGAEDKTYVLSCNEPGGALITVCEANKVRCSKTTETSEVYGTYQWPSVDGGMIEYLPCQYNVSNLNNI